MKFLETHRKDIIDHLNGQGYHREEFHFIKRKGRIITQHRNSKKEFSYFLKKSKILDERPYFQVKYDQHFYKIESWPEVQQHFKRWLVGIMDRK